MLKYLVVYASETGNTKKIADEIFYAIPSDSKEEINVRRWNGRHDAETYFIGYWANRGTCSLEVIDLIMSLHGKNVAFFGTCGMGNDAAYYRQVENIGKVWLPDDNKYLGGYFCQGSMPIAIRERYQEMRGRINDDKIERMVAMFDEGISHPDRQDLLRAHVFADTTVRKIPGYDIFSRIMDII
ncbi:flavodoxin family protein BilS [Butyrivibrio sp. WCE2006]|uniref:flavodoxin family protein BilS n=1 Tax=Butyrivibrio sp. WCE2006 TaxID=1410611 RepID=UPI0005D14288|nr:flavodoxin family protein BilS [Butyrivibrio sp. WCE2006]